MPSRMHSGHVVFLKRMSAMCQKSEVCDAACLGHSWKLCQVGRKMCVCEEAATSKSHRWLV